MSNHIPGPLYAINGSIYKDFGDVRYRIADVDPYVWDDVEATAHLMAAAPELLEALKDMLSGWRYLRAVYGDLSGVGWDRAENAAIAAIAKAEGGSNEYCA